MIFKFAQSLDGTGYIAGTNDGIVTVLNKPESRQILLLDVDNLSIQQRQFSFASGNYAFFGLDPAKRYLVMVRDYKKEYEPFVWDDVKPADDLTLSEQQALWQSWQSDGSVI